MSAIQRFIDIFVNNSEAVNKLEQTEQQLNNVDKATTQVTQSTDMLNKKTQQNSKSLRENGGAMGFLGAATRGASNDIKDAIEAVEGLGVSFKGVGGAIKALSIAGLALLVLDIATNWDKWRGIIDGSAKALEELNRQREIFADMSSTNQFNFDKEIAKEEELLRKYEAQGKSQKELDDQREVIRQRTMTFLNDQIKELDKLIDKELTYYSSGVGNEEEREKSFKKRREAESQRLSYQIQLNKLENDPEVLQAQRERDKLLKSSTEQIQKQIKLISEYGANANSYLSKLISIKEQFNSINQELDNYTQTFKDYINLSKLWYDAKDALDGYNSSIKELTKARDTALSNVFGTPEEIENQRKAINEAYETQRKALDKQFGQYKLLNPEIKKFYSELESSGLEVLDKLNKKVNEENKSNDEKAKKLKIINNIQKDIVESQNKLLGSDYDLDGRLQNSNRFLEIENKINEVYTNRERLIERTIGDEVRALETRLKNGVLLEKQAKENFDKENAILQEMKKGKTKEEIEADKSIREQQRKQNEAEAKYIDQVKKNSELNLEFQTKGYEYELEMFSLFNDKKVELTANSIDRQRALRDEQLEREAMYSEKAIAIAEETANMLNDIAALGGKKSEEFAKAALKIQKVAGVARVVIATQEEIRGIWSNPALTALPDTGIAKKTILTAAAAARSAISIATILSQKIGGSPSSASIGTGGPTPEANFNVVAASGTNQLAATIASQQNQPVRAYVVGSDISTEQALSRNRIQTATFL